MIQTHKVTRSFLVPPIVLGFAKHPAVEKFDISSLKVLISGAAPLS
jgi:4-coumarate--CoA ligase